ncbi:MAG: hypothetical protein LBT45_01600 [Rickettsiales bacterium]|jgi:hypothetical protein|nr:hypothetical protein [Rickettsiales bacterium]
MKKIEIETRKPHRRKYAVIIAIVVAFFAGRCSIDSNPGMSNDTCGLIEERMSKSPSNSDLKELSVVFSKNCRRYRKAEKVKETKPDDVSLPEKTCAAIESLLLRRGASYFDEWEDSFSSHIGMAENYAALVESGCPENREKYRALAVRELEIALAMDRHVNSDGFINVAEVYGRIGMAPQARAFISEAKKRGNYNTDDLHCADKIFSESVSSQLAQ